MENQKPQSKILDIKETDKTITIVLEKVNYNTEKTNMVVNTGRWKNYQVNGKTFGGSILLGKPLPK